jgi:GT2 family glycosyltransferase
VSEPLVYIIVLNWNGRELVLDCLRSIQQLRYSNVTAVVVDNGSIDGSVEAVKEQFPDVILIENMRNLRWSGGNNEGIKHALENQADYIILLNNDTIVDPDMITKLVEAAEQDPSIGLLGPKIYYHHDPELLWYAGGRVNLIQGRLWHTGIREKDRGQYDQVSEVDYITGCALMIRAEVAHRIGLIDPAYIAYCEDVDYSIRAKQAGYRLVLVPSAKMWHKVSAYWGVVSQKKIRMKLRSQLILYRRYAPVWAWFTTIPLFMLLDALRVFLLVGMRRIRSHS